MKKLIVLLCFGVLFLYSGIVLADEPFDPLKDLMTNYSNHVSDDGVIVAPLTIGDTYINLTGMNRSNWYNDNNGQNGQNVSVNVRAEAYIPCYIEMKVTGNKGQNFVQSFGPLANAAKDPETGFWLQFDNEVGGFVDENWNSIGHGKNAEIQPDTGVYIQGCDVFKVEVKANDTYKYQVESAPLTSVNADTSSPLANDVLDLQMRTSLDNSPWITTAHKFSENGTAVIVGSRPACESMTALHQFRVPYDQHTAHGKYEGNVIFRAVTI